MKNHFRAAVSVLLAAVFFLNNLPVGNACGPGYLSPVFDYKYAPENPFEDFASGKTGIIKPSYHRVVLFAAYRYLNGGGFSANEQKSLVAVWNADFNNTDYVEEDVDAAVKMWLERRKDVVGKEEKLPEIYTERQYENGYDFFPNCTKSAFETAAQTLSDRVSSYGADNQHVKNWVAAQDAVFTNCTSGKQSPEAANRTMPEWLQKDRAYQQAAAEFYSLDYDKAKNDFAEIARDADSPWRETADYLVARTLIRQASLNGDERKRNNFYREAEQQLQRLSSNGGRFAASTAKFANLIKYRLHPQERVRELAQTLSTGAQDDNFRQDLIDYYWLLDKFEKETLEKEEKRKAELKPHDENSNAANANAANPYSANTAVAVNSNVSADTSAAIENKDLLTINFYSEDYKQSWTIHVKIDATDDEAIAEAERVSGFLLTDKMKEAVRSSRRYAYQNLYRNNAPPVYEGGYYGEEKLSLSPLPDFLRGDDLTDWLFAFQAQDAESYDYAVSKFRQTNSDIWLMTAISKAGKNSVELKRLLEAANRVGRNSPAYATVAYHEARIFIEQNRQAEAKKLLDEILSPGDDLPVSSRNQFLDLRLKLTETLDDFLRDAQKMPFTFDWDGESGTIADFIKREKEFYDPEYNKQTREEYEREVDERYKNEVLHDGTPMLDDNSANVINEHFPVAVLLAAHKSPALPDYLKERFALAVWTRAALLDDMATASKIVPEIARLNPENETAFAAFLKAKTPSAQRDAALFLILKNENLTPYISTGLGSPWEGYKSGASRWWCSPYDGSDDDNSVSEAISKLSPSPKFLTAAQNAAAQDELKKLKTIGDAPKALGERVLEWAKRAPLDRRVPESLYIAYEANGWDKYGCGSNEELREEIGGILKKRYPKNEWTRKMIDEETPSQ